MFGVEYVGAYMYACASECVCVCVCMREREKEREREHRAETGIPYLEGDLYSLVPSPAISSSFLTIKI